MEPKLARSAHPLVVSRLVLLILASLAWVGNATAQEATRYKVRNRWLSDRFLADSGGSAVYGAGAGDDSLWTLEDDGPYQRVRNVGTGAYLSLADRVVTSKEVPTTPAGRWEIEVGVFPWRWVKNAGNGKYLNCERKLGYVECDMANLPRGDNFWSGQWELIHAGGPTPPPYFRRNQVAVTAPAYGASIQGETRVEIRAPGLASATVQCWKQGPGFGVDSTVAEVALDGSGRGSFVFPADSYPRGPITVRISGRNGAVRDNCYLQLYNRGGVSWREGIPKGPPPAAIGLPLAFADDFDGPLSISSTDPKATYYDHKPPDGHQDFSTLPFTGHESPKTPFAQVDTYLRIRADEKTRTSGLISSLKKDASGVKVSLPCYFECRFLGPNAVGAWPAFWLMTDYMTDYAIKRDDTPVDELDVIEAYGGEGPGSPNAEDRYMVTPHCWNQGEAGKALEKKAYEGMRNPIRPRKFGIPSTWFESPHVYGCKVTETDTIYYCDDVEVGRHATLPISKERPLFFMINLATGGGWPVDLSRYDGRADLYVDYVRVYGKR
jgi:hypothetical protein